MHYHITVFFPVPMFHWEKIYSSRTTVCLDERQVCLEQVIIRLKVIRRGHTVCYLTYSPVYNRGVS